MWHNYYVVDCVMNMLDVEIISGNNVEKTALLHILKLKTNVSSGLTFVLSG